MKIKKILAVLMSIFLLVAILPCSVAQAEDITLREAFPDTNFRAFVKSNYLTTYNDDSIVDLTARNILSAVTGTLDVSNKSISDLTGVRYFTGIISLDCSNNNLTSLNLGGCSNLRGFSCSNNNLTSLNLGGCSNLGGFDCSNNKLTSLDVGGCITLTQLTSGGQKISADAYAGVVTLPDGSAAPIAQSGDYESKNWTLDGNKFTKYYPVNGEKFSYNFEVASVSTQPSFDPIDVTVTVNHPDVTVIEDRPPRTISEVFTDSALKETIKNVLGITDDADITEDKVKEITTLDISGMNISNLDGIEYLTKLETLNCSGNNLTSLDGIESLANLYKLDCSNNKLTSLNISNTSISGLDCSNNQIPKLKLSMNSMDYLYCGNNSILNIAIPGGLIAGTENPVSFSPQAIKLQVQKIGTGRGVYLPKDATLPKDGTLEGCTYDSLNHALVLTDPSSRPEMIKYMYSALYGYDGSNGNPMYEDVQVTVNLDYSLLSPSDVTYKTGDSFNYFACLGLVISGFVVAMCSRRRKYN